jgi:GT2 family glycosyltransferase
MNQPLPPDLTISIVSYNTRELLRECLTSLHAREVEGEVSLEIIVTDNSSDDGSLEMVRREFPEVISLEAGGNLGYGRANNLAFKNAAGRYFLILNSDTQMPPGVLRELRDFLDAHSDIGAAGAQLISPDGKLQASAGRNPSLSALLLQQISGGKNTTRGIDAPSDNNLPYQVDWLCGGCLCVRSEAFAAVQGFDPAYFMYLEDCDLALRLRRSGWKNFLMSSVQVPHRLGASSRSWQTRARMIAAHNQSCIYYFQTHQGKIAGKVAKWLCVLGAALRLSASTLLAPVKPQALDKVRIFRQVLRQTLGAGAISAKTDEASN